METPVQIDLFDKRQLVGEIIMPTSQKKRFFNFLLDILFFYLFLFSFGILLGVVMVWFEQDVESMFNVSPVVDHLLTYLFFISYYTAFEAIFGKTIGKMITNTKVVNEDGTKPTFGQIVGRSFARLIPFEAFSLLANHPRGWHDTLSRTMVVDDIALYKLDATLVHPEEDAY